MRDKLKIVLAITIGLIIAYAVYAFDLSLPCYNGARIADSPNYCLAGRR